MMDPYFPCVQNLVFFDCETCRLLYRSHHLLSTAYLLCVVCLQQAVAEWTILLLLSCGIVCPQQVRVFEIATQHTHEHKSRNYIADATTLCILDIVCHFLHTGV